VLLYFVATTFLKEFFEARAEIQKYFRWFFGSNLLVFKMIVAPIFCFSSYVYEILAPDRSFRAR
jgi:hypothetical protein